MNTSCRLGKTRRREHIGMNDDKPKKKLNNVSTKTPSEYEQEVRSVAESLSVFGGGLVSQIHSMALCDQVPIDRLYAWMHYMKNEQIRSHFKGNIFNLDHIPEVPWEPASDNVPRLPFCCSESVKLDSSVGLAKLKELNNKAP